jgi:hypothetical protein
VVRPGEDLVIEILATSGSDTPIDFFDVTFAGEESVVVQRNNEIRRHGRRIVEAASRLREQGTLTEGEHRFTARFKVPLDAPASCLGALVTIRYEVRVHVAIPWWPDLRETYELLVEPHPEVRPKPAPARASSAGGQGVPFLELSVADTTFAVGDEVSGGFSVGNLAREAGEGVEISLVGIEHLRVDGRSYRAEQLRHNVPNVFGVPRAGREVHFRFRVPKGAVPSFKTGVSQLEWTVQAVLRLSTLSSIACGIPVVIGRYAGGRAAAGRHPDIGAARWRAAWAEAGEPHGLVLAEDRLALVGSRGDVRIEVKVDEDGDEAALAATFRYPSIMLGLRVKPQLLVMLPSRLELLLSGYKIEHREHEQAAAFLGSHLREALARVKLVSAGDTSIVVRGPVTSYEREGVGTFLEQVSAIAGALVGAIGNIPPPAAMVDALPAWRAFAAATGARLTVGHMSLRGASVDGAEIDVLTLLGEDGEVHGTRVELKLDPPLPARTTVDVTSPVSLVWAPPGAQELAETLRAQVTRLQIGEHFLAIELPGATAEPAELRPRMIEMIVLARRLRGDRSPGPYR